LFYKYQLYLQTLFIGMATFTSTLPDDLLRLLSEKANSLSMPKNKLIENALRLYLEHLEKAEYIKSYKEAPADIDILTIAEEGMSEYLRQFEK
jgi:predicted transcriptional regulator